MANVKLVNMKKIFGKNVVIENLNLEVPDGSFMVMVGPSGCGKSTALRCIAGLEEISAGQVFIGDDDVTQAEPKDRNIAMVFQNYALYPHMNVFENITYGLKVRGLSLDERKKRAAEAAKLLGLSELLERTPRQLSGGQRQRVAMGRAIVREPSVFLFDEPLSNLDANLRNQMRIELRQLHERLATTSIYVTHDQVEAMTLAEKILVLRAGKVEQYGAPDEIYSRPASAFVAQFMGSPSMNILSAKVTDQGLLLNNSPLPNAPAPDIHLKPGNAWLGVRSEDLIVDPNGNLQVEVAIIEALGSDTLVHCHVLHNANQTGNDPSGQQTPEPLIVRLPGSMRPKPHDILNLAIRPGHAHIFDYTTNLRCI